MSKVDAKKFSAAIKRGSSLSDAMIFAGYSPASAKRGKSGLSKECKQELEVATKKMFHRAETLSKKTSDDQLRHAVRGGLIQNLSERVDKGVQSLKLAGSLKELNMFQADNVSGVIILEVPSNLPPIASSSVCVIEAPVDAKGLPPLRSPRRLAPHCGDDAGRTIRPIAGMTEQRGATVERDPSKSQ